MPPNEVTPVAGIMGKFRLVPRPVRFLVPEGQRASVQREMGRLWPQGSVFNRDTSILASGERDNYWGASKLDEARARFGDPLPESLCAQVRVGHGSEGMPEGDRFAGHPNVAQAFSAVRTAIGRPPTRLWAEYSPSPNKDASDEDSTDDWILFHAAFASSDDRVKFHLRSGPRHVGTFERLGERLGPTRFRLSQSECGGPLGICDVWLFFSLLRPGDQNDPSGTAVLRGGMQAFLEALVREPLSLKIVKARLALAVPEGEGTDADMVRSGLGVVGADQIDIFLPR